MNMMQMKVNEMHNGNVRVIMDGASSNNDYLVMNAILSGAKCFIKDDDFMDSVLKARKSDSVLLGIPLKSVADAAYYYLTNEKYTGSDEIAKTLIMTNFEI